MKLMTCPVNGVSPVSEFVWGGVVRPLPDSATTDDRAWASYVFDRVSIPGVQREWWCHTPSNTWFIAERNTLTDEILDTYLFNPEREANPAQKVSLEKGNG